MNDRIEPVRDVACPICGGPVQRVVTEHTAAGQGVWKTTEKYRCAQSGHMPWGWTPES